MKNQTLINIILIGAIIYLIVKFRNYQLNNRHLDSIYNNDSLDTVKPTIELKPLNWAKPLKLGDEGSEIVALQLMLTYFNPSQAITGMMDEDTEFRMRSLTSGIFDGDIALNTFAYSIFQPRFPGVLETEILPKFPNS